MSGDREITSGNRCKFSRKFRCIVGSYFSIIVVYKNIVAVYIDNVESKVDILQPGLFISSLFIRYAPFKNKEKPRKTNKNRGFTNKNMFFLVSFCFYLFLKGAERKSRQGDRNGFSHVDSASAAVSRANPRIPAQVPDKWDEKSEQRRRHHSRWPKEGFGWTQKDR